MGVEYVPAGMAEMAWVEQSQLSGSLVGERDGLLVPALRSVGGYVWGRHGVVGGLSVARVATTVVTTDNRATSIRMATRPSVAYRYWCVKPAVERPLFYGELGVYGVVPFAEESAQGASEEDEKALNEDVKQAKGRIGGLGVTFGLGAEVRWKNGMGVGLKTALIAHRSQSSNSQTQTVSSLLRAETAFTLSYWF